MLRKQDNLTTTLIAKDITSSGLLIGNEVKPSNSLVGEVFITDKSNKILAAYPATGAVRLIQSMGATKPLKIVDIADVTKSKVTWSKFKREVQKDVVIGFNPITSIGSLNVVNNQSYHIHLIKRDNDAANRSQPQVAITGQFMSSTASSQLEIAHGLTDQLFKNILFETINHGVGGQNEYVAVKVVSDATIIPVVVGTGDVSYGSALVQLVAAPAVAVGQEIQILTDCYIVEAVDPINFTITLKSPYRGSDRLSLPIDDAFTTPAVNYGIRVIGVKNPFNVNTFRDYYTNRFDVVYSDRNVNPVIITDSFEGVGVWEEVAMNEYMSWGFVGQNSMLDVPPTMRETISTPGATYGTLQIRWVDEERDLLTTGNFKGSVLIYCELAATAPDTLTAANAGSVVVASLIANATISADGLIATSLDE